MTFEYCDLGLCLSYDLDLYRLDNLLTRLQKVTEEIVKPEPEDSEGEETVAEVPALTLDAQDGEQEGKKRAYWHRDLAQNQ